MAKQVTEFVGLEALREQYYDLDCVNPPGLSSDSDCGICGLFDDLNHRMCFGYVIHSQWIANVYADSVSLLD